MEFWKHVHIAGLIYLEDEINVVGVGVGVDIDSIVIVIVVTISIIIIAVIKREMLSSGFDGSFAIDVGK